MKSTAIILAALAATSMVMAQDKRVPMTAEQKAKLMQESGGMIMSPEQGAWISVVNGQSKVASDVYEAEIDHAKKVFKYPFHTSATTNCWRIAAREEVAKGAAFAVVVGNCEKESSLVVLPSEQIAFVNVAPLATDDVAVFNDRFHKELLRGLAYAFGMGNSATPDSILKPIKSVKELDSLQGKQLGADALMTSMRLAKDRGMFIMRTMPYKAAVYQGWAPAPTNDIQKAIWEKVKAEKEAAAKPAVTSEAK